MSNNISVGKVIKKPEVELDDTFFLPPGLIDVKTGKSDRTRTGTSDDDLDYNFQDQDVIEVENPENIDDDTFLGGEVPTPDDLRVISQTLRFNDEGKLVVDVLCETSNIPGVKDFEVRLYKAFARNEDLGAVNMYGT